MALLNYGKTLSDLVDLNYLKKPNESGHENKKYLELVFSNDGHIITHGQDYLKDFVSGKRGLVPDYPDSSTTKILGKNGWSSLTTAHLPIYTSGNYDTSTILNSSQIYTLINNLVESGIAAHDAMVFKGPIDSPDNIPKNGYSKGWTYRITAMGVYLGTACQPGDLLIAKADAEENQSSINTEHWFVVDTNVKGLTNININGLGFQFSGNSASGEIDYQSTIYGPVNAGTAGQLLTATGNTPIWANPSTIQVGKAAIADTATKLANSISFGNGLTQTAFDGSIATTITLAPATTSKATDKHLGGVMVDDTYLTLQDGIISINADKFASALGNVSAIASILSATSLSTGGIQLQSKSGNLAPSTVDFIGTGPVVVSYVDGKVDISVSKFTGSAAGLVPDAPSDDRNKFLKADGTWAAILNNVTYNGSITDGSIAVFDGTNGVIKSTALADLVTKTYITQTLGAYATENTWRTIQVAGTSIGDKILNFVPAGSIAIVANPFDQKPGTTDTFDIGFDLYWWNLDRGQFEQ